MGKSPGRWIRTLLFGKKSSKSTFSKRTATERESVLAAKAPSSDRAKSSNSVLGPALHSTDGNGENSGLATGTANLPNEGVALLPENQNVNAKRSMGMGSPNTAEIALQEQAITKVQAAYRGYLARRAFRALKGIIRLQAVVRGHLVRRQAVATLYCVRGIVKLQALVRGQRIRFSDAVFEVHKNNISKALDAKPVDSVGVIRSPRLEKLSANAFVVKLLVSSPTPLPLHLQYDPLESNSAWSWLDRWSISRFWEPLMQPKKSRDSKSQRKQANSRSVEPGQGRPKRGARRASTVNSDHSIPSTSEHEKNKHGIRKPSSFPSESAQEDPQNELERVKRNLRKVSVSNSQASARSETVIEKSKQIPTKMSNSPSPDVLEHITDKVPEKPNDLNITASKEYKEPETNILPIPFPVDEPVDMLHNDHPVVEVHILDNGGKDENTGILNEESVSKVDQTSRENQKARRRKSLPIKQEYPENVPQNTPTLPSYMQATQSAKAKLRGHGSLRLTQDEPENGSVRRHSLPSATNGKVGSPSPRVHRLAQASGKGAAKTDRSLLSSRDSYDKAGWRR